MTSAPRRRGFQVIALALEELGVTSCFTLVGDCNLQVLAELADRGRTRVVQVRDENLAVAMADGFSRMSGRPGFATVTCGPGLTQAATSLAVAARRRSPLVLFAGDLPSSMTREPVPASLKSFTDAVGGRLVRTVSASRLRADVFHAFEVAERESLPVVLSIPVDFQHEVAPDQEPHVPLPPLPVVDGGIDRDGFNTVVEALRAARRPILVAGRGALGSTKAEGAAMAEAIQAIADHCGALLATTVPARDLFASHPRNLGISGGLTHPSYRAVFGEADLILAMGASMDAMTRDQGRLFPSARVLRVEAGVTDPVDGWCAMLPEAAHALAATVQREFEKREGFGMAAPERIEPDPVAVAAGFGDPERIVRHLGKTLPDDVLFVNGIGHHWWFPMTGIEGRRPESYLAAYEFGVMGQASPTAAGASFATERPIVVFEGDGGLMTNVGELETYVREGIGVFLVVFNDGAYGAEVLKLRLFDRHEALAEYGRLDFAGIARAFGMEGHRATDPETIAELFRQRRPGVPVLIDVPVPSAHITGTVQAMAENR